MQGGPGQGNYSGARDPGRSRAKALRREGMGRGTPECASARPRPLRNRSLEARQGLLLVGDKELVRAPFRVVEKP